MSLVSTVQAELVLKLAVREAVPASGRVTSEVVISIVGGSGIGGVGSGVSGEVQENTANRTAHKDNRGLNIAMNRIK